jgi:hypothetical protein
VSYTLAGELSNVKSSNDIPKALERYEEVFRPKYAKMEDLPPWWPQIAFPQTVWGLWIRNSVLWLVSKTGLYKLFQGASGENERKMPLYNWVDIE